MPEFPPLYSLTVPEFKSASRSVAFTSMTRGGVVFDASIAATVAEILLERHYGKLELDRQRPLLVQDKGDYWRVEGSFNRDQKIEGEGPFFLSIHKYDGRIVDIGRWEVLHPDPSVVSIIETELRRRREQDEK